MGITENHKRSHLVNIGDFGVKIMPYSEVCMHMRIAGKVMMFQVLSRNSVQIYDLDGKIFSFPIGYGEAGFYSAPANNPEYEFYYYDAKPEGKD
jgi:hypothetical protein